MAEVKNILVPLAVFAGALIGGVTYHAWSCQSCRAARAARAQRRADEAPLRLATEEAPTP